MFRLVMLLLLPASLYAHPCDAEVSAACPDRAASEMVQCLKDPSEHEKPTTLSSECTDFVALAIACAEDIDKSCDEDAAFSDDTLLCLTQWTKQEDHSEKCQSVMKWAVPQPEEEEEKEDGPTDELGLSEKDYAEKKEWQEKRRAGRGDAIERIKMKEQDRKNEEDRVALEQYKRDDPEGYAQMVQQQEEEKRQQLEFKKRERQQAAALQRKQREAAGLDEDGDTQAQADKKKKKKGPEQPQQAQVNSNAGTSTMTGVLCMGFMVVLCVGGYLVVKHIVPEDEKKEKKEKKDKKKRN